MDEDFEAEVVLPAKKVGDDTREGALLSSAGASDLADFLAALEDVLETQTTAFRERQDDPEWLFRCAYRAGVIAALAAQPEVMRGDVGLSMHDHERRALTQTEAVDLSGRISRYVVNVVANPSIIRPTVETDRGNRTRMFFDWVG